MSKHSLLRWRIGLIALCLAAIAWLAGCGSMATRKGFYTPITAEVRAGRIVEATALLEKARADGKYGEKDRLLYYLDAGFLNHYASRWDASNQKLHLADAAADELFTKSISKAAASMLLNDNALEYAGEDYEVLYANLISALNYAELGSHDDAFVEIRRANLLLEGLQAKYDDAGQQFERKTPDDSTDISIDYSADKVRFHNDAFARWLSMHMYASDAQFDDADIDYTYLIKAFEEQPHIYDFDPPPVRYRSDSGAVLSVVGLLGLAPTKQALNLRLRTDKDLGLVQILYDGPGKEDTEYGHLPINVGTDLYLKFSIPQLVDRVSQAVTAELFVDGTFYGELSLLEDVGQVSRETFAARKSLIYLRSVARTLVKGLATTKLKKKVDTGGLAGWLKKAAVDVASDLTENADLRCSEFMPDRIMIGDFDLTPGIHDIEIIFENGQGELVGRRLIPGFRVSAGYFNLISASCPR